MFLEHQQFEAAASLDRRATMRQQVQCRARIRIGDRHYAGYLHNISEEGAKLRTISPIRKIGRVVLTLPDLEPVVCELRWNDSYNAGVQFEVPLPGTVLSLWARTRVLAGCDAGIDLP